MPWTRETALIPASWKKESALTAEPWNREAAVGATETIKEWFKNFNYSVGDIVVQPNNKYFKCTAAHHSLSNTEPGEGADWQNYWVRTRATWQDGDITWQDADHSWNEA